MPMMHLFFPMALFPLLVLPAEVEPLTPAQLLVEAQVQTAAAAAAVLEKRELPPAARAERLLPLAGELARLHALRGQVDAAELEAAEAHAAADAEVQHLALRLLRAVEICAASDYSGSVELREAVKRLSQAIDGDLDGQAQARDPLPEQAGQPPTAQSDAE